MKEAEIEVIESSSLEEKELAAKLVRNIEDTKNDDIQHVFQKERALAPGHAGAGMLEAVLTIIFTSKAIDYLAKAIGDQLKKERKFEIKVTDKKTGKSYIVKSENNSNVQDIIQELKKVLNNI